MSVAAYLVSMFMAANVGASGTAAAMGAAYGGGALNKRTALVLVALMAFAGAMIGGSGVVKTIGSGLMQADLMTLKVAICILLAASLALFLANLTGIPLSTSEVTVGAVVGAGLSLGGLNTLALAGILLSWVLLPLLAFGIAFTFGRLLYPYCLRLAGRATSVEQVNRWLSLVLILAGSYEAFAAGTNNVANAVGPLVGAGLMKVDTGLLLGGAMVGLGAISLGGRVLETNAHRITDLCLIQGSMVSLTSGSLVLAASYLGLPVPMTQATTMAIIGVGCARYGSQTFQKKTVKSIFFTWALSPLVSLVIAYTLVTFVI